MSHSTDRGSSHASALRNRPQARCDLRSPQGPQDVARPFRLPSIVALCFVASCTFVSYTAASSSETAAAGDTTNHTATPAPATPAPKQLDTTGESDAQQAPAPQLFDSQAVNLRPAFVEGRTSRYSFWTTKRQETVMTMDGKTENMTMDMKLEGEATWTVKKVHSDGSATCELQYDFLTMTVTLPDGEENVVDSRKNQADNPHVLEMFRALTQAPIIYEMAADGRALSVSGTKQIAQRLAEEMTSILPSDEEHLRSATELATLPAAPATLATGGNWQASYDWKHEVGRVKFGTNYHLKGVEVIAGIPVAVVETTASPKLEPDYSQIPPDGPKVNFRQTQGSYNGQVMFDLQRHETVGYNLTQVLGMDVSVTYPEMGMQMRQQATETTQAQVLRIAEKK